MIEETIAQDHRKFTGIRVMAVYVPSVRSPVRIKLLLGMLSSFLSDKDTAKLTDPRYINPTGRSPVFKRYGGIYMVNIVKYPFAETYIVVPHWELFVEVEFSTAKDIAYFYYNGKLYKAYVSKEWTHWLWEAGKCDRLADVPPEPSRYPR